MITVNHLLETSHPFLPPLYDSVSLWPTRLPFSVRSSKFRMPQLLYLPGPPGDPQSFHSFSQFQIPAVTLIGKGNPS